MHVGCYGVLETAFHHQLAKRTQRLRDWWAAVDCIMLSCHNELRRWQSRSSHVLLLSLQPHLQAGAVIYASRVPERWYPGKFDIAGHSHQLWHAAVVLAAWVHYLAMMILLQWRDASGGCAVPSQINGPVEEVFGQMQQMGKAPLAIHEVDSLLQEYAIRRLL